MEIAEINQLNEDEKKIIEKILDKFKSYKNIKNEFIDKKDKNEYEKLWDTFIKKLFSEKTLQEIKKNKEKIRLSTITYQ